jgi:hypothetical protein
MIPSCQLVHSETSSHAHMLQSCQETCRVTQVPQLTVL